MEWLVTLSICPPPKLMTNFCSLLEDTNPPPKATPVEGTPQALETVTFRVPSPEEARSLVACWEDYFRRHYPKVKLRKPQVTFFSGD